MKYTIKLEAFHQNTFITGNFMTRWSAQVVDRYNQPIAIDDDYGLGYAFGDTKEEALLKLVNKLKEHEQRKRELRELNIKMGETVEVEV